MPHLPTDLTGMTVVIVGAEFAAGGAIARACAAAGADVALCSLTADEAVMRARAVRRTVEALGRRAVEYVMDVTLGRNVQVTLRQIVREMGRVDVVVCAPEFLFERPIERTTDAELARVMQVHFAGSYFVVRHAAEEFRRQGRGGRIILITSEVASRGADGWTAYAAAHGAIQSLIRSAALEVAPDGIAVNAIALRHPISDALPWDEVGAMAVYVSGPHADGVTGEVRSLADDRAQGA